MSTVKIIIWLVKFSCILNVNAEKYILQTTPEYKELDVVTECIIQILSSVVYFQPTVITGEDTSEITQNESVFHTKLVAKLSRNKIPVLISDSTFINDTKVVTSGDTIFAKYISSCDAIEHEVLNVIEEIKYLLVLFDFMKNNCKLSPEAWRNIQKNDVTIITKNETNHFNIGISIPRINRDTCNLQETYELEYINACENGILKEKKNVFPVKNPSNLQKCTLRVGMAKMYPYSMVNNATALQDLDPLHPGDVHGSDVKLIEIIGEYFNASIDFRYIFREEKNPFVRVEFIKLVINGSLDICAGGMYRIYGDIVSYSGIYSRQAVFWVYSVKRGEKSWENLIEKTNGLYIFIVFYACYNFLWYVFRKFDNNVVFMKKTLLSAWGCLIAASGLEEPNSFKQKLLNSFYLILCLHFSAYISIQLYSFLTIYGPPEIFKTNDEIYKSNRIAYLNNKTKYFTQDKNYLDFARTSRDCSSFETCQDDVLNNKGVSVILDGYFYPAQAATAVNYEARMLKVAENVLVVYHEIVIRKDHQIVKKFQRVMMRLFEAGICGKLYFEAMGVFTMAKAEIVTKNIASNSYSCTVGCPITYTQSAGVFYLLALGYFLSVLIFIFELFMKRDRRTTIIVLS